MPTVRRAAVSVSSHCSKAEWDEPSRRAYSKTASVYIHVGFFSVRVLCRVSRSLPCRLNDSVSDVGVLPARNCSLRWCMVCSSVVEV